MMRDSWAAWQTATIGAAPASTTEAGITEQVRQMVLDAQARRVPRDTITQTVGHWWYTRASSVCAFEGIQAILQGIEQADRSPMTPQEQSVSFPFLHERGARRGLPVKGRIENTAALIDAYGVKLRYNLMAHDLEIEIPGCEPARERSGNVMLYQVRALAERHGLSKDTVCEHINLLAREYHPVRDWITSAPWDGADRITPLIDTVKTSDPLANVLIRSWLRQCAAAVSGQRFRAAGVLTFSGPQGCGKTSWVKRLEPQGSDWIGIGLGLDPHNRDSVQQLTGHWIAELGELDGTFRRADIAALKAFVDRPSDTYRSAYSRREETIPRRTVLFASVNRRDCLIDDTGNRRWWCVDVTACNWRHDLDTQQLWAQVYDEVARGVPYQLDETLHAELNASNARFEAIDPLEIEIFEAWQPGPADTDTSLGWQTIRDIVSALPGREDKAVSKREANAAARILRAAGVTERGRSGRYPARFAVSRVANVTSNGNRSWRDQHDHGSG